MLAGQGLGRFGEKLHAFLDRQFRVKLWWPLFKREQLQTPCGVGWRLFANSSSPEWRGFRFRTVSVFQNYRDADCVANALSLIGDQQLFEMSLVARGNILQPIYIDSQTQTLRPVGFAAA